MIRTELLTKRYGDYLALRDVNLCVNRGEIYGFLGPNGAGKTTTMLILLGLVKPTSGKIYLFGNQIRSRDPELFSKIGTMGEEQHFYDDMEAKDYLLFFAQLVGVSNAKDRVTKCLEEVGLTDVEKRIIGAFSHGMRQKLALARALLSEPEILFLDEPVSGLDPHGIRQVRELILKLKEQGTTIFISSHVLTEVERLADRVGILSKGQLLAEGPVAQLQEFAQTRNFIVVELISLNSAIVESLRKLPCVMSVEVQLNKLQVEVDAQRDYRPDISRTISENGGVVIQMESIRPSLEDAFVTITDGNLSSLSSMVSD